MRILFGTSVPGLTGGIYAAEQPFQEELKNLATISVRTLPFGRRSDKESLLTKLFARLFDVVRFVVVSLSFKPHVVHLNSSYDRRALLRDLPYALVAKLLNRRVFLKLHGSDADLIGTSSPVWRTISKLVLGSVHMVGVLSSEEKRLFEKVGYHEVKFSIVPNTVDCKRFAVLNSHKVDPPNLLFIGRFISTKGLLETIEATRLVLDSGKKIRLTCVGDGPQRGEAEALVMKLGIHAHVQFTGFVPEKDTTPFYQSSSALVFPTYHQEGFPMAVFQSLAAGLPIITTRIRAVADYLTEPDNCLWVEPRDPKMLAQKITRLLEDRMLQDEMFKNNSLLAQQFSAEKVSIRYLRIYGQLCEGTRGGY